MVDEKAVVLSYFPELEGKWESMEKMKELYMYWNERINVISRKDMDNFFSHHVLHSLAIAKYSSFFPGAKVIDVGTGGGFPGVPLALFFPEVHFTLVDSIAKKISVVQEVSDGLQLKNITPLCDRMENVKQKFDFIITRAVAPMIKLNGWTRNIRTQHNDGGLFALKGGDLAAELKEYGRPHQEHELKNIFSEPFFETKKLIFAPYF